MSNEFTTVVQHIVPFCMPLSLHSRTHVLRTANKVVNPCCGTKQVNYVNEALVNYQSSGLQVPNMNERCRLNKQSVRKYRQAESMCPLPFYYSGRIVVVILEAV